MSQEMKDYTLDVISYIISNSKIGCVPMDTNLSLFQMLKIVFDKPC